MNKNCVYFTIHYLKISKYWKYIFCSCSPNFTKFAVSTIAMAMANTSKHPYSWRCFITQYQNGSHRYVSFDLVQGKFGLYYFMFFFYFSQVIEQLSNVQTGVTALHLIMHLLLWTHESGLVYRDATWNVL